MKSREAGCLFNYGGYIILMARAFRAQRRGTVWYHLAPLRSWRYHLEPFFTSVISYLNIAAEDTFRLEFPWSCGQKIHCLSARVFASPRVYASESALCLVAKTHWGKGCCAFIPRPLQVFPLGDAGREFYYKQTIAEGNQPHGSFLE